MPSHSEEQWLEVGVGWKVVVQEQLGEALVHGDGAIEVYYQFAAFVGHNVTESTIHHGVCWGAGRGQVGVGS